MTSPKKPINNTAAWIITLLPFAIILFGYSEKMVDPVIISEFTALSVFLLGFSIYGIRSKGNGPFLQAPVLFDLWFFRFYIAFIIISGISLSYTSTLVDGLFDWLKIVLAFMLLLLFSLYFRKLDVLLKPLIPIISVFTICAALVGFSQLRTVLMHEPLSHQATYSIKSVFAHRNLFAEVMLMCLPFCIFGAFTLKGWKRLVSIQGALCSLFFVIILLTRAVWFAGALAGLSSSIAWLLSRKNSTKTILPLRQTLIIMGASMVLTAGIVFFLFKKSGTADTFGKQASSSFNISYGSAKDRIDLWKKSFSLFKENPLMGAGLASWKIESLRYNVKGTQAEDGITFYQSPHNDFIWVMAETGIFGILAYLLIFLSGLYYVIRLIRMETDAEKKILWLLMFFTLTAYCVFANYSFPKERIPENILLGITMSIILIGILEKKDAFNKAPAIGRIYFISVPILLILCVYIGMQRIDAERHLSKMNQAYNANDWERVETEAAKSQSVFYNMDPVSTPVSWYRGMAWFNANMLDSAMADFAKAYAVNPYHIHVLNNLATCFELKGMHDKAVDLYRKSLAINPAFEETALDLCAVYYHQNKTDSAYKTLGYISPETKNTKYPIFRDSILVRTIDNIIANTSDTILKPYYIVIKTDNKWRNEAYIRALGRHWSLQEQMKEDVLYLLKKENKDLN